MAIYRTVQLSFWTDNKVVDDFTPEDKYFYLYLFTNPQTNLCGCYEVSLQTMANQTGYNKETILRLLDRFENVHNVLVYSSNTKEICLLNWSKYNWQGGNQIVCLEKEIAKIKDDALRCMVAGFFDEKFCDYKPLISPLQATVTVNSNNTDNINNLNNINNKDIDINNSIKDIIDYLNIVTNSHYTYRNKSNNSHIKARLEEGHTVDEFKTVIDKMQTKWGNDPKMVDYLRPQTLFGNNFESYLNSKDISNNNNKPKTRLEALANA